MRFRALCARFAAAFGALAVAGAPAGALVLAAASIWSPPAAAQAAPVQASASASGEVVRVNATDGKIAIRHGAIGKLDLPAMTLVYHTDPALLAGIAVGDKVSFTAERTGGQYRIVELKKN
ncbi:copper-binding protein [Castellaniella hirudinis]|uniref:Copper-binding protein n=1 Tax=Castellaniella hirudinis TaxID=1144617 RepID=A0ABV8S0U2_9BURK